jgi:hypothetical protein
VHPLLPRGKLFSHESKRLTFEHTRLRIFSTACIVSEYRSNDTALPSLLGERASTTPNAACRLALPIVRRLLHFIFEHFSHSPLYALQEHFAHLAYCRGGLCEPRPSTINTQRHLVITALKPTPVLTAHRTLNLCCMHIRGVFENFLLLMFIRISCQSSTLHRRSQSSLLPSPATIDWRIICSTFHNRS